MSHIARPPCDEAAIRAGVAAPDCGRAARRWVLVAAILGSSLAFVDGTVVNVALPAIQRDQQATAAQMQWVIEAYALLLAALLLVGGSLGDHFGRKRVFTIGVAIFTLASIACALADSVHALIVARGVQGAGAALLVPGSLALISAAFPERERGRAIGTWSGFSGVAAAVGPVLGGFLVDHYSWPWAFLVNAPLGAAVIAIAAWRVPESKSPAAGTRLDVRGAVLATVALGGIVFALIEAPVQGWRATPVLLAASAGVTAAIVFVLVEQRTPAAMLPLHLFRNRDFAGANLLTLLLYAALGGSLYFLPLNLIQVQGYSAAAAGAALLPFIAIMFTFSRAAGALVERSGPRLPLMLGPILAAAGFALLALPGVSGPAHYATTFLPGIVVLGAGMTLTVAPLTTTVMNALGQEIAGVASGVNNAVSRTAALLAIAGLGLVLAGVFDRRLETRLAEGQVRGEVVDAVRAQRDRLAGIEIPREVDAPTRAAVVQAIRGAYVDGYRAVMVCGAVLALLSAAAALLMIGRGTRHRAGAAVPRA